MSKNLFQLSTSTQVYRPRVIVSRITHGISREVIDSAITMLSGELPSVVGTVCIKVNLCDYRKADSGATTDPLMLEQLVRVLKDRFTLSKIFVIENDATAVEANSLFKLLGFGEIADRCGLELLSAASDEWIQKTVLRPQVLKTLAVPRKWIEADLRINFAKLKTNSMTKTTGCLKNMFGLLREKHKSVYHSKIDSVIADINQVMKSDLCIVDGLIGQEGPGPAFGVPKLCELLVAGTDPVAVDACSARIMGFNPRFVKHIRLCQECGVGNLDYDLVTDIPKFSYRDYRFRYSRTEHLVRTMIRRFFHVGAAG